MSTSLSTTTSFFDNLEACEKPSDAQLKYILSPYTQDSTVIAYAASGKTNTIMFKLLYHFASNEPASESASELVNKLSPLEVVLCSYTNIACAEMVERGNQLANKLQLVCNEDEFFSRTTNCFTIDKLAIRCLDIFMNQVKTLYKALKTQLPLQYKRNSKLDSINFLTPLLIQHFGGLTATPSNFDASQVEMSTKEGEFLSEAFKQSYAHLKLIIIDEAQDTYNTYYEFVKLIQSINARHFNQTTYVHLVGDVNQKLYYHSKMKQLFLHSLPAHTYTLNENYRNTKAICDIANMMLPTVTKYLHTLKYTEAYKQSMQSVRGQRGDEGQKPILFAHRNLVDSVKGAIEWIQSSPERLNGSIAFIVPKRTVGFELSTILSSTTFQLSHQIMFTKESDLPEDDDENTKGNSKKQVISADGKVVKRTRNVIKKGDIITNTNQLQKDRICQIFTIHGSKGLSFNTVVLLGFYQETWNLPAEYDTIYSEWQFERFWYTAITRAENHLAFAVSGGVKLWSKLATFLDQIDIVSDVKHRLQFGTSKLAYIPSNEAGKQHFFTCIHECVEQGGRKRKEDKNAKKIK